jgi:hypothetical protein
MEVTELKIAEKTTDSDDDRVTASPTLKDELIIVALLM